MGLAYWMFCGEPDHPARMSGSDHVVLKLLSHDWTSLSLCFPVIHKP